MADYTKDEQAEHREMWTSALRSGYYKQTTGALQRRDYGGREAYCCLGVACDISELGEWIGRNYLNRSADLPT